MIGKEHLQMGQDHEYLAHELRTQEDLECSGHMRSRGLRPFRFVLYQRVKLPFYQFTQPSVAVSPYSVNLVDFFDSFSVRFL